MRNFVCLDTNIYVRIISQGKPGCEEEYWNQLNRWIVDGSITLLVPEIVLLELQKQCRAALNPLRECLSNDTSAV